MKHVIFPSFLIVIILATACRGVVIREGSQLEITIPYERQPGPGSNQYAIWIEDTEGNLVKTLFVTNFTAKGGYTFRPACTPVWIKKANIGDMTEGQIDAISGATPQSGNHVYSWDMTDSNGAKVKPGTYTFIVEANLWDQSVVTFKGTFETGKKKQNIEINTEYTSTEERNKNMITSVTAKYINN